ncbi:microtubule associated protein [Pochonia chlamydosporia 170]|uniref:Microtubule associated protein n=1 Tax=Pochonia chlamydosporia 170 TaxID=1380566 RepID=A0A179FHQ6_METCM|nr:microtubule associated protein [Pochonia chlamydosporia 170]OAQ65096.1 microtubule associated protein [Pochonia chlamydosporia 170]
MRKLYNPIGFKKGYNFVLWLIFAGAMMGFSLARIMFLNYDGVFCGPSGNGATRAGPGECWRYNTKDVYRIGIRLHLYTIIPAAVLVCFQFTPIIRYKAILFHRVNGYIILLLSLLGTIGVFMIARVAFGGGIDIQVAVGVISIMFLVSLAIAYYNIKKLQLEQHRAWMLRAWFYSACIITCRIIMGLSASVISTSRSPYYKALPCDELATFYNTTEALVSTYPECHLLNNTAPVRADLVEGSEENIAAALNLTFGMGLWLALVLHAIGIEVYLHLTPAEAERLRNVSYQRQLEAGFKSPGRAGLTADRLGDCARWNPTSDRDRFVHDEAQSVLSDL